MLWQRHEMLNQTRVKSDLVIGFGFSKSNADEALLRYKKGRLTEMEASALDWLFKKDPFTEAQGQPNIAVKEGIPKVLNKLNFRISQEKDNK